MATSISVSDKLSYCTCYNRLHISFAMGLLTTVAESYEQSASRNPLSNDCDQSRRVPFCNQRLL